jgi:hypothetical protein
MLLKEYVSTYVRLPEITLNIERELMPQISSDDIDHFLTYAKINGVNITSETVHPETLKATQGEFNVDKILSFIANPPEINKPVMVSSDDYIMDGHHGWIARLNKDETEIQIYRFDVPVMELLSLMRRYPRTYFKTVNENTQRN